ncbi:hypothetical protein A2U01_0078241, partial [Trifolium medium]|nr:hypothetical protein [Trifolium medium]
MELASAPLCLGGGFGGGVFPFVVSVVYHWLTHQDPVESTACKE